MPAIKMPYGQTSFVLDLDDSEISAVVRANKPDIPPVSQARAVREAIGEPICSPKLEDILHPGEKVCLIVLFRSFQYIRYFAWVKHLLISL